MTRRIDESSLHARAIDASENKKTAAARGALRLKRLRTFLVVGLVAGMVPGVVTALTPSEAAQPLPRAGVVITDGLTVRTQPITSATARVATSDENPGVPLDGTVVAGGVYVFADPTGDIDRVEFFLDDPAMGGSPEKIDRRAPYELRSGNAKGNLAKRYDLTELADGVHTLTVRVLYADGSVLTETATFAVQSDLSPIPSEVPSQPEDAQQSTPTTSAPGVSTAVTTTTLAGTLTAVTTTTVGSTPGAPTTTAPPTTGTPKTTTPPTTPTTTPSTTPTTTPPTTPTTPPTTPTTTTKPPTTPKPPTTTTTTTKPPTTTTTTTKPPPPPPPPPPGSVPNYDVMARPGDNLQSLVNANPNGTVFWLRAGTYKKQEVKPKSGQVFIGESGAILDGANAVQQAFKGSASNVEIRGLVIKNYASKLQFGAIWADGSGWVIANNELTANKAVGIKLSGNTGRATGNNVHHNGQFGITAQGSGVVIESNTIASNNTGGHDSKWAAGGTKFARCTNITVRNNKVSNNNGPGLWTDISCKGISMYGNTVTSNKGPGIRIEISYNAVVRNNTVKNNGSSWGNGIGIIASADVEVYGNVLTNDNVLGIQGSRGSGTYGPHVIKNLWVHDNTFNDSRSFIGLQTTVSDNSYYTSRNNRYDRNTYKNIGTGKVFHWSNGKRTPNEWVNLGQDKNGKFL